MTGRRLRKKTKAKSCRQARRRQAVRLLCSLGVEVQLAAPPLPTKSAKGPDVERFIRLLETRCQEPALLDRLRKAAKQWSDNGGHLSRGLVTEGAEAQLVDNAAPVTQHKVLLHGFTLQSRAFMLTYNNRSWTRTQWPAFNTWVKTLSKKLGSRAWAACMEVSMHAAAPAATEVVHAHAYLYWKDGVGVFRRNLDDFVYDDVRPRVDVCTASGRAFQMAACHGLWYVTVMKDGTLFSDTNYQPLHNYPLKEKWLTDLYAEHKLTHAQYLELSAHFRVGHAGRKRDVLEILADEKRRALEAHIAAERTLLESTSALQARRSFPVIDTIVQSYSVPAQRRPVVAIVGGTGTGKSILGGMLLKEVGAVLGLQSFLEVTVEADDTMALSDLDIRTDAGVLLDGVGDAMFLERSRESLQGRAKTCKGGKSATMMYSYSFSFCRRLVVATFDLAAKNLRALMEHHWLRDPKNVCTIWLDQPAWSQPALSPSTPPNCHAMFAAWSVGELAHFLDGDDLEGPSRTLRANGVRGQDLLSMDLCTLVADVGLTQFAAKRVLQSRDLFLQSGA